MEHDGNATGFYLCGKEGTDARNVGHFPINRDIKTHQAVFRCKKNYLEIANVVVRRKREVGR